MRLASLTGIAVLSAAPVATGWWAWCEHVRRCGAELRLDAAREGSTRCRPAVEKIRALRNRPRRAAESAGPAADLANRLESAVRAAEMPASSLAGVLPSDRPARIGRSHYSEHATRVLLERVTAFQLVRFLTDLKARTPELNVKELRLRADPIRHDLWSIDVHLAVPIFDPAGADPGASAG